MQHRGRHRRRRRGRALRAGLAGTALALTAAATLISTSQAAGDDTPGALTPLTSAAEMDRFQLHESLARETTLDSLTDAMGGPAGVHEVLRSADRPMRNEEDCSDTERAALPLEPTATRAYCWDTDDAATREWLPRSVTTSGDATADGTWGGDRVILAGWTHTDGAAGGPADGGFARVAFIDASDPEHLRYQWVLLVAPREGGTDFAPVRSRAGGMVWYRDKLIVTAHDGAASDDDTLYVFDLDRILRAGVSGDAVGRVDGGWSAHRHRYVMPAVGSYTATAGTCTAAHDGAPPCFASLSLDRTSSPHSLVATSSSTGDGAPARVWRYPFSTSSDRTGLLGADPFGFVGAEEAYETEATGVRGVLSHRHGAAGGADWYVGHTPEGQGRRGTLWRQDEDGAAAAECTADGSRACWGRSAESLSYWPQTGELWTLTERAADPGDPESGEASDAAPERVLYAVPLASVDESLD